MTGCGSRKDKDIAQTGSPLSPRAHTIFLTALLLCGGCQTMGDENKEKQAAASATMDQAADICGEVLYITLYGILPACR